MNATGREIKRGRVAARGNNTHKSRNSCGFPPTGFSSETGFSLIELLVVLSILVVILGTVGAALSAGIATWDAAVNFDAARMDAALLMRRMERDLGNAFPFYAVDFEGNETGLRFAAGVDALPDSGPQIAEIQYRFDPEEGTIVRSVRQFGIGTPAVNTSDVMLDQVRRTAISYSGGDPERDVSSGSGAWREEDGIMPAAVMVELVLGRKERPLKMRRLISLPIMIRRGLLGEDGND